MADPVERLTAALGHRYAIQGEIGRGGMATVFLAEDLQHGRHVAIKVLDPELGAAIGSDRFVREIRIAAQLRHANVLPLYDSGAAEDLLFYVMPFVEGESLRDRLDREKQLPVDEAIRIAREVAAGLAHAHEQGIVHRDIKPENILLDGDRPIIMDFGIARAVAASDEQRLTQTGLSLGTPLYMSPEQATGTRDIDARADVYALGCVLHEMLAGQPPFSGPTAESVIRQQVLADPPALSDIRSAVAPELAAVVHKAMQKTPADRFATAKEFADALAAPAPVVPRRRPRRRLAGLSAGVVSLAVGIAVVAWMLMGPTPAPVDPNAVAVMPFRVDAADDALDHLGEGIVDVLHPILVEEGSRRYVDVNAVVRAIRADIGDGAVALALDDALRIARRLGAGQVVTGSFVGAGDDVIVNARVTNVESGESEAIARVEGARDTVFALLNNVAAQLLSRRAGEMEHRIEELVSHSPEAVRSYLAGKAAYRRGEYRDAGRRFEDAMNADSSFALAGLYHGLLSGWIGLSGQGVMTALAHRERLGERSRALLDAFEAFFNFTSVDHLVTTARAAVRAADNEPEPWYWLGEVFFHFGTMTGAEDSWPQATEAFEAALAIDSAFAPALQHLVDVAASGGDVTSLRRYADLYEAVSTDVWGVNYARWRTDLATGDTAAVSAWQERLATDFFWGWVVQTTLGDAVALDHGLETLRLIDERGGSTAFARMALAYNQGRPDEGHAWAGRLADGRSLARQQVWMSLLWDGDVERGAEAAENLGRVDADAGPADRTYDQCVSAMWWLWQGDVTRGAPGAERLAALPDTALGDLDASVRVCLLMLDAVHADRIDRADRSLVIERLDSVARAAPAMAQNPEVFSVMNLVVATLLDRDGSPERALAAARRRMYWVAPGWSFLSSYLREQARLAAGLGYRDEAIRAYQHYLRFRRDPEPRLQADVSAVRMDLEALLRSASRE